MESIWATCCLDKVVSFWHWLPLSFFCFFLNIDLTLGNPIGLIVFNQLGFLLFLFNSSLDSEEIYFHSDHLILAVIFSVDRGGQQKNILGCSFKQNLELNLTVNIEVGDRLPEGRFGACLHFLPQPNFVFVLSHILEFFFGD